MSAPGQCKRSSCVPGGRARAQLHARGQEGRPFASALSHTIRQHEDRLGIRYALVYPGLGAEAVRRAPPQSRGLAMGAYTVFLDVALGFGSPALGLVAGWQGLGAVFLASAILVLAGAVFAAVLLRSSDSEAQR